MNQKVNPLNSEKKHRCGSERHVPRLAYLFYHKVQIQPCHEILKDAFLIHK